MYLVKSINRKHKSTALKNGNIRIGTINYYRAIEDDSRQDGQEGLAPVVWKGRSLSAEDHNRIITPFDKHVLGDGWTIENRGVPLIGAYPNFNAFVFCYSEVATEKEIAKTSGGKANAHYFITDLPKFLTKITNGLKPVIERLIEKQCPKNADELLKKMAIFDVTYRVNYSSESKGRIVDEENIENFDPWLFRSHDFFQKSENFSYEQEVRTVWIPIANIGGRKKPLQIPPDITHFDLTLGKLPISKKRRRNRTDIKTSPLGNSRE